MQKECRAGSGAVLYYEESEREITITGGERKNYLVIPKQIDGLPVVKIGTYAFCEENLPHHLTAAEIPEGVKVIGEYAFSECRELEEIKLPSTLLQIGKNTFYNCRKLNKVHFLGMVSSIEDGAFKNCEKLTKLTFSNVSRKKTCLKSVLEDISHTVHVRMEYIDETDGCLVSDLLFPGFDYEFVANEPARIFSEIGYGSGYLYHQCFFQYDVDYDKYDRIFPQAVREETEETVIMIAKGRLQFPYRLSRQHKERYLEYFGKNLRKTAQFFIIEEDKGGLDFLLQIGLADRKEVKEWILYASDKQKSKMAAYLFECQKSLFPKEKKEFNL